MSHTKEPWVDVEGIIYPANGREDGQDWIADCRSAGNHKENARRIVACVNACAGIETEALVGHALQVIRSCESQAAHQRDELLAAEKGACAMLTIEMTRAEYDETGERLVSAIAKAEAGNA